MPIYRTTRSFAPDQGPRIHSGSEIEFSKYDAEVHLRKGYIVGPISEPVDIEPTISESEDTGLEHINGIGPKMKDALYGAGVPNIDVMADLTEDEMQRIEDELEGINVRMLMDWRTQARRFLNK